MLFEPKSQRGTGDARARDQYSFRRLHNISLRQELATVPLSERHHGGSTLDLHLSALFDMSCSDLQSLRSRRTIVKSAGSRGTRPESLIEIFRTKGQLGSRTGSARWPSTVELGNASDACPRTYFHPSALRTYTSLNHRR